MNFERPAPPRDTLDKDILNRMEQGLQGQQYSEWFPDVLDWHSTYEESSRAIEIHKDNLPTLKIREVRKSAYGPNSTNQVTVYRFSLERNTKSRLYSLHNLMVSSNGAHREVKYTPLFSSTIGKFPETGVETDDYYESLEKIGLLDLLKERLPENIYQQPGVYGLEILNTILRAYFEN